MMFPFDILKGGSMLSRLKGRFGELRVRLKVGKTKVGVQYVLNNYMFLCDGKSVQIDHIVINQNGVFVIETKNYSGKIYGSDGQKHWLQVKGARKTKIYSPANQNSAHISRLSRVLEIDDYLVSLVVFVQNNTENITSNTVIPIRILKPKLRLPCKIKPYTPEQMKRIFDALERTRNTEITEKEHIASINEMRVLAEHDICPICRMPLVSRVGKYGEFLGCSGYPECKYSKEKK